MSDYITTIGIECHVQLKTKTKLFAAVDNDARGAEPNTLISHICLGLPGALPVLNDKAVELASRAAFALNTKPQPFSKFDRKHYFYPDLPMGYQITQFEEPVVLGGHVDIVVNGEQKRIGITRAHLEADAGKSTHPAGTDYSLVDLNRAGTPLLEIVSEPDMHSSAEARAFAHELYLLMKYAGVGDADLYHGNMRFDVNVSVSKDPNVLGTRSETKNLNSFKSVEKAVEYEVKRQIEVLEEGGEVVQETRGWDDTKLATFSQRTKEDAHDYRYFPDPDLPPIELDQAFIDSVEKSMNMLPAEYRTQFAGLGIDPKVVEDIVNVPETAQLVARILETSGGEHAKRIAFWTVQKTDDNSDDAQAAEPDVKVDDKNLVKLSELVSANKLSSTAAKEVLKEMQKTNGDPEAIATAKNLIQESNEDELAKIVAEILAANEKAAEDVKNGEMKAIGFLVGQVMKASQGKANPGIVQQIIKKQLNI
ncbi:MAG: Aspartyl/glutamyl-tRNA(Asn/Gln) amidotransferase subunit [Candidatus Saccharibacteria bacterium]|nr:Aspartyl/glutamyl-tRNA(Asn/Gln) amidotransferase subunit [Candidatus Saccharibacteria bacterium]